MGITGKLTRLLRNLYAAQEATVRTLYGTTDCFKIEKGVWQGCLLVPCLFNLGTEYTTQNAVWCTGWGLDELQAGIKIARRSINNLRYTDDTTLMAESKEERKSLLMRVKEESEKAGLILWPPNAKNWLIVKDPGAGKDWRQEEKGTTEDEMAGWHHRLNGHEFGWTPGVGDGQGGMVCCDSWGRKESDTTERLNWTEPHH